MQRRWFLFTKMPQWTFGKGKANFFPSLYSGHENKLARDEDDLPDKVKGVSDFF
jgi:hypothetical protein